MQSVPEALTSNGRIPNGSCRHTETSHAPRQRKQQQSAQAALQQAAPWPAGLVLTLRVYEDSQDV